MHPGLVEGGPEVTPVKSVAQAEPTGPPESVESLVSRKISLLREQDEATDRARVRHGLPPLNPPTEDRHA